MLKIQLPQTLILEIKNSLSINELLRKLIHILICVLCALIIPFIPLNFGVLFGFSFIIIIIYLDKNGYLQFLEKVKRISAGHYFMFLGVLFNMIYFKLHPGNFLITPAFVFSLICLGFADSFAVLGRPITNYLLKNHFKNNKKLMVKQVINQILKLSLANKTVIGSCIFTIISFLVLNLVAVISVSISLSPIFLIKAILLSIFLALIEIISPFGLDNLLILIIGMAGFLFVYG